MKLCFAILLALSLLGMVSGSVGANAAFPNDGVIRFSYGIGGPRTVRCAPYYVSDIALEQGETIMNIAIGDSIRWVISPAASGANGSVPHVLVKPTTPGLQTDLIITTTKRSYTLLLVSTKVAPMLEVAFSYPQDIVQQQAEAGRQAAANVEIATPRPRDYRYRVAGTRELYPDHVYNEGSHTYIEMAAQLQKMPAVLVEGPNGDEIVNYRMTNATTYMVDGVPDRIALVIGTGKHRLRSEIIRGK